MADITALAQNTLLFSIGYIVFAIGITIYSLYLNHKQAKVHKQMDTLIKIVKKINNKL